MNVNEVLTDLDNSWSKEDILKKIKAGQNPETIVNDFARDNEDNLKILGNHIKNQNLSLLENLEVLSRCETKLIDEIRTRAELQFKTDENKQHSPNFSRKQFKLDFFIQKWSNQFVIILLIVISLISLTKQAWA